MKHSTRIAAAVVVMAVVPILDSPAAFAKGVPVEAASASQMKEAVKQYRLGVELLGEAKFEEALGMFRGSYEKVASPNSRLMVARALIKLERYPEAHKELVATIADASELVPTAQKYQQTVDAAKAELAELSAKIGQLKLVVDGKITVNATPIEQSDWQQVQVLAPGQVKVTYELSNGQRVEKAVTLEPGKTTEVELFSPPPASAVTAAASAPAPAPLAIPPDSVSYDSLAWVSAGVGAGGLLTFAVFGLLNNARFSDLEDRCVNNRCTRDLVADAETGRTYQTLANVGLSVGLVGGLSAAYFFLSQKRQTSAQITKAAASRSNTELMVHADGVTIRGQF